MRRREFIAGLGSATAWPLAVWAQQPTMPVVGYLDSSPIDRSSLFMTSFHRGLSERGYVEGRNVAIQYRSAMGQYDLLLTLAADLVQQQVAVIATTSTSASALAAKSATITIPIVFWIGGDPVKLGLVSSLNKPGGNVTGVTAIVNELTAKRVELFRRLLPNATKTAVLVNPNNPNVEPDLIAIRNAARTLGLELTVFAAGNEGEIDAAFAKLVEHGAAALFVAADSFLTDRRGQVAELAARHAIPIIGAGPPWIAAGASMAYSDDRAETSRQFGTYVGRILKGDKPADLPIAQPTKFEFVINLKTAKALGLTIPETLLATADEVIQ